MTEERILEVLRARLDQNMEDYANEIMQLHPGTIMSKAREIYAAQIAYNELFSGDYQMEHCEYLIQFANPLEVVRDQWLKSQFVFSYDEMEETLNDLIHASDAKYDYELDPEYALPDQDHGMAIS